MVRSGFKIPGIFMLLCGVAAALPQAQIRTGVSAKDAQAANAPVKAVKNNQTQQLGDVPASNNRQQKPTPAVVEPPAPVVPATQQVQQVQPPLRPEQMPP